MTLPAGVDLYVNEYRELEPLNLVVLRDSRVDLFPRLKERTEQIPGRHGDIEFGSKLEPRLLELNVAVKEEFTFTERESTKRTIAQHLDPTQGTKVLVFADEPDKKYYVKYSGNIDITQYLTWFQFTIPFKCSDPYLYRTTEEVAWSNIAVGMGDVYDPHHINPISLINNGNVPVPVIVDITGESISPSITIGSDTMQWNETVESAKNLRIDTGNYTITYDGDNALHHYNNIFPKLQPGDNLMTVSGGGDFKFTWIEKWV